MVWNTGEDDISAGTIVYFSFKNDKAFASIGFVKNTLKISKNKDAVFAYIGLERMLKRFLAGIANDINAYGTLNNTGLEKGKTAIVLDRAKQKTTEKISDFAVVEN